ncbi:hypothetical protein C8J57DRAFT_1344497 [Mycena rebaudengoi]|nr:hypothetical protein C8J57DRAFT_1344497 [Mycena rebaudengoi]
MSHIPFFKFTHPDAKEDLKDRGPSPEEARINSKAQLHVCSSCSGRSEVMKECGRCHGPRYCSRDCQVADWKFHKQACTSDAIGTDLNLKLAKKLTANDYLMSFIMMHAVLSLDLLNNPANADSTYLAVTLTTADADPMAYMRALINREERAPGYPIMLQVSSIEKRDMATITHIVPGVKTSLVNTKAALAASDADVPVVMLIFTSGGANIINHPCPIPPEILERVRIMKPFQLKSALSGLVEVPMTEQTIVEHLNNAIYMDKENRYLLRTKSHK